MDATPSQSATPVRAGPPWWLIAAIGAVVVLLSFGAAFLGARLGQPPTGTAPVASGPPEPSPEESASDVPEVLPAGADVRAGVGVADPGHGEPGDVFIDVETADVYVRDDEGWRRAGNIRTAAVENLTGDRGEQGEQGKPGETGAQGKPGASGAPGETGAAGRDGTQVVLGTGTPTGACANDGDVFIDTVAVSFYECRTGTWAPSTVP
ncbi:MAG: collagen-like protein [Microbacterium sp.]